MAMKTIKVSEENYRWLLHLASELQKKHGRIVSFDVALNEIKGKKMKKKRLRDIVGRWKMSELEAKKMLGDIRGEWKKWKIPSA